MNSRTPNNVINQQLSAFLDGELSQAELPLLLRQLEKQPELLSEAQRLQQAQLCVLGEQPVQSLDQAISFCQNIHTAIAAEEAEHASPAIAQSMKLAAAGSAAAIAQTAAGLGPNTATPVAANDSFWKGFAGAGVAAAVAMLAVNLWQAPTVNNSGLDTAALSAVAEQPAETYTVPKYVAPSQTDSTTFFLEPGDLKAVGLVDDRSNALERFNYDYSDQLLANRTIMLRMHQAENLSEQLLQENTRLRQQLDAQAYLLKSNGLTE